MIIIYPFLALFGEKLGKTINKYNFRKNKTNSFQEIFLNFLTMFVVTVIFTLFFSNKPFEINFTLFFLLIAMIVISFLQNVFEFNGVSKKDLCFREPISNLQPLIASFMAFVIFPSEREIKYVFAIILGVLIWYFFSRKKDQKINFDKGTLFIFGGVIFSAILVNIYKFGLETLLPEYIYLVRIAGVIFLLLMFKGKFIFSNFQPKGINLGILGGIFYSLGFLTRLYSIMFLGLNFTLVVLLMGPVLVYLFSYFFLKEKISKKQLFASGLITSIVLITVLI
jgi:drug/metabolite transporter (DMT)-like permease